MRTQLSLASLLLLLLIPSTASSEEQCQPQDTPRQCVQRLIVARAYESAQADLAAKNTGTSALSSPLRSAVKDFLSAASAHVDGSSVKDNGTSLILDYNLPSTIVGSSHQANFEATIADAKASPAVQSILDHNPSEASSVEQLGRGDDVVATLSFNAVTKRFGRSLEPHRSLFDSMLTGMIGDATQSSAPVTAAVPATSYDTPFAQLFPKDEERSKAMADFEAAAVGALPAVAEQAKAKLSDLADRQPQLYVTGLYHYQKALAGPRGRGARVTWEIGTNNVNTFRRREGRDCETKGTCYTALREYNDRIGKEHRTDRLALSVEYSNTSLNDVAGLTNPSIEEAPTYGFEYAATYGREVTSFVNGRQGRIDFTVIHNGGKTRKGFTTVASQRAAPLAGIVDAQVLPPSMTRRSAALTFTQPLIDRLSMPVGIVVADHVDSFPGITPVISPAGKGAVPFTTHRRTVEVHVGLRYQVPQVSSPSPSAKPCCCK
jgi:hypothetical protein